MKHLPLVVLILFAVACSYGQSLPVKPGLWENVVFDDDGKPMMTALECMTPSSFVDAMTKMSQHPGCTMTAKNITSHGMTVDLSCTKTHLQMTTHGVLEVIDPQHVRSTTTVKMTVNGQTNQTAAKSEAHFKAESCGDIKPNEPKITSE